ncbi:MULTISPECIES: cytochrome oxidase small assembly protein [Advenella]|nr:MULTISPECIES: cytochrome oxidase small assembly protein [Advenella]
MTPEQKRRNRIVGLILAGLVVAIFLWAIFGHVLSAA